MRKAAETDHREREADAVAVHGLSAPSHEEGIREHVGNLLGFDFSAVRLHRDATEAEAHGAHALTSGADVYLAPGRYRPELALGRALVAHELAHVAQQRAAPRLPIRSGVFVRALGESGWEHSSDRLAERAATLVDPQPLLTPAPLGMQQRCVAGCKSCSSESEDSGSDAGSPTGDAGTPAGDAGKTAGDAGTAGGAGNAQGAPTPGYAIGPSAAAAGTKVIRVSWTVDDGPTPFTPNMSAQLSHRPATWFIMSNQLGSGTKRATALSQLVARQNAGDEIGIHSMHSNIAHSAWFPISLSGVSQGYTKTADAMNDLKNFTGELRSAGLNVHFARMPGGELSEVKKYVEQEGGPRVTSKAAEDAAQKLISGATPPPSTPETVVPETVVKDVRLVMSTLKSLNLHLWGGSATGPEVERVTWETESSGVPARTNDVVNRITHMVDALANRSRKRPASFIVLSHDTTTADVTQAGTNISAMEKYATDKKVRIEYYRESDLYRLLRGAPP